VPGGKRKNDRDEQKALLQFDRLPVFHGLNQLHNIGHIPKGL
jgi:hypothetical protein